MPNPATVAAYSHAPALESLADLAAMLEHVRGLATEAGRTEPLDVMYMLPGAGHGGHSDAGTTEQLAAARELADLGITWLGVNGEGDTVDEVAAHARRAGDEVLSKL